MLKLKI